MCTPVFGIPVLHRDGSVFCPVFCDRGFKINAGNTSCNACEVGTYKAQRGNTGTCVKCPANITTADVASTNKSDCNTGK